MDKERIKEFRKIATEAFESRHATYAYALRDALDALEAALARAEGAEASAEDLRHAVRFLAKQEARTSEIRGKAMRLLGKELYDEARELIVMHWPIVQGLRNQLDIAKVGEQPCDLKRVRPAINSLLEPRP